MSNNEIKVNFSKGANVCGILTIVFIALKLCKVISWSWFWVLSPIIFNLGLFILIVLVVMISSAIVSRR